MHLETSKQVCFLFGLLAVGVGGGGWGSCGLRSGHVVYGCVPPGASGTCSPPLEEWH